MSYDLAKLPIQSLLQPISEAAVALTRLDERIARSPVGEGFLERSHFLDAHASLWVDGELVHLEDLVLHDALRDIRAPTHELTIARDILKPAVASPPIQPPGRSQVPASPPSAGGRGPRHLWVETVTEFRMGVLRWVTLGLG